MLDHHAKVVGWLPHTRLQCKINGKAAAAAAAAADGIRNWIERERERAWCGV